MAVAPVYRLLDRESTGLAGRATVTTMDIQLEFVWFGLLLVMAMFVAGGMLVPAAFDNWCARVVARMQRLPVGIAAAGLGLLAAVIGAAFSLRVLEGNANLIDSFAQLLQARYLAAGMLAGPADELNAFWAIQNTLFTDRGWVSQYPPGHVAILALFMRAGVPWLAGPLLMGMAVMFTTLAAARLMPGRIGLVLLCGGLLAVSPFFVAVGASYMNHVAVAGFVALGAYALVRFWEGRTAWSLLAGAAFAAALTVRPLSTVAMAAALVLMVPCAYGAGVFTRRFGVSVVGMAAGSLPLVGLLMAYNRHFFGSPLRFGYEVAMGPHMRLGFGQDPWGNAYGVTEAVAYTNADLMALGVNMFESPLSALLVIGMFMLLAPRLTAGERVLAAWAMAPVVTNFFYWHHGNFMGPRMVFEALPAWVFLFGAAAAGLVLRTPASPDMRFRARTAVRFSLVTATAAGLVLMAPQRLLSYGGNWQAVSRTPVPHVEGSPIIFVHDAWSSRVATTLIAHGYRLDLLETLLRQNSTCSLHLYASAIAAGDEGAAGRMFASLDTIPRPGRSLPTAQLSPGNGIRIQPGEQLEGDCARQARSDRFGVLAVEPLLWQGVPYGVPGAGPLIVRDLGPDRNATLLAAIPGRTPYLYLMPDTAASMPVLVPYAEGMQRIWD